MRVIVFGSRTYAQPQVIWRYLDGLVAECVRLGDRELTVVQGMADGADKAGWDWAIAAAWREGVRIVSDGYPADWDGPCDPASPLCQPGHRRKRRNGSTWCPTAGFRRNGEMADGGGDRAAGFIDKPLAESRGSRSMHQRCLKASIPVELYDADGEWVDR